MTKKKNSNKVQFEFETPLNEASMVANIVEPTPSL
jgi:hypothetical protein